MAKAAAADGRAAPEPARAPRAAATRVPASEKGVCRVPGCTNEPTSGFLQRCRCCEPHSKELEVDVSGVSSRFCQQCGFFHPLEEFDGERRSCRKSLERHRVCRRLRRAKAAAERGDGAAGAAAEGDAAQPQGSQQLPTPRLEEPVPAAAAGPAAAGQARAPRPSAPAPRAKRLRRAAHASPPPEPEAAAHEASSRRGGAAAAFDLAVAAPSAAQHAAHPAAQLEQQAESGSCQTGPLPSALPPLPASLAPLLDPVLGTLRELPSDTPSVNSAACAAPPSLLWGGPHAPAQLAHAAALRAAHLGFPPAPGLGLPPPLDPALGLSDPWAPPSLPPPPPLPAVEQALAIMRAPTPPVFHDLPGAEELLGLDCGGPSLLPEPALAPGGLGSWLALLEAQQAQRDSWRDAAQREIRAAALAALMM